MSLSTVDITTLKPSLLENILVIPRSVIPGIDAWHGLKAYTDLPLIEIIKQHKEFLPRYAMEEDFSYKQIIPYLIFCHNARYFVMERRAEATEQRLSGKLTIGIGGHLNEKDLVGLDILEWAQREFEEEVSYAGSYTTSYLGMINDDTNDVGKVHLGLVLLLQGNSDEISIKDEHKQGYLLTKKELLQQQDRLESWSALVLDALPD